MCQTWTLEEWKQEAAKKDSDYTIVDEFVGPNDQRGLVVREDYTNMLNQPITMFYSVIGDDEENYRMHFGEPGLGQAIQRMTNSGFTSTENQQVAEPADLMPTQVEEAVLQSL